MSDNAQGIIVAIEETPAPSSPNENPAIRSDIEPLAAQSVVPSTTLSMPPKVRIAKELDTLASGARTPSPVLTQEPVQVRSRSRSISPTAVKPPQSPHIQGPSPLQFEGLANDHVNSSQLLRKGSNASFKTATHSPVMRSMFPRYDGNVPLGQQQYRPGASLYSHHGKQSSKPALPILDIPSAPPGAAPILQQTSSGPEASKISSSEELLDMWSIANGQAVKSTVESFSIELIW